MKTVLISLFSITIILGCQNKNELKKNSNAQIIWQKHDNGKVKVMYQYFNDTTSFDDDYLLKEYYETGLLKISGLVVKNKKQGEWKVYNKNGILKGTVNFNKDTLIGPVKILDSKGEVIDYGDIGKNGSVNQKINNFIINLDPYIVNPAQWFDSLKIQIDSIRKIKNGL